MRLQNAFVTSPWRLYSGHTSSLACAALFAHEHAVGVHERPAGFAHLPVGLAEQLDAVRTAKPLVARRKQRADVAEARGAQDRVEERVGEHVTVGMARKAARVVEPDAAE